MRLFLQSTRAKTRLKPEYSVKKVRLILVMCIDLWVTIGSVFKGSKVTFATPTTSQRPTSKKSYAVTPAPLGLSQSNENKLPQAKSEAMEVKRLIGGGEWLGEEGKGADGGTDGGGGAINVEAAREMLEQAVMTNIGRYILLHTYTRTHTHTRTRTHTHTHTPVVQQELTILS